MSDNKLPSGKCVNLKAKFICSQWATAVQGEEIDHVLFANTFEEMMAQWKYIKTYNRIPTHWRDYKHIMRSIYKNAKNPILKMPQFGMSFIVSKEEMK